MKEALDGGFINEVYREGDTVTKFYRPLSTVVVPVETRFANEASALTRYGDTIAPRIYEQDESDYHIVMEYVAGGSMKDHLDNGCSHLERQERFAAMGRVLKQLHEEPAEQNTEEYLGHLTKKTWDDFAFFINSGVPNAMEIDMDRIRGYLQHKALPVIHKRARERGSLCMTHGDIWSNNMIDDKAIDWEFSTVGMPEEDLVQVYMWDLSEYPQYEQDFMKGYGAVPDTTPFRILKLLDYMEGASLEQYEQESGSGFITDHAIMLKEL